MSKKALFLTIPVALFLTVSSYADNVMQFPVKNKTHYLKSDIDKDNFEEEISVTVEENELEETIYKLTVKDARQVCSTEVLGFYHIWEAFSISLIEISKENNPFIGLGYHCGAHSYRLALFTYNGNSLHKVFDGFSDSPEVIVKDTDNDGIKEIICKNRDYESSSLSENYLETYKYINHKWERVSVYRMATKEYMPKDWDKNICDIEAYKNNMKKFGLYEPEDWENR